MSEGIHLTLVSEEAKAEAETETHSAEETDQLSVGERLLLARTKQNLSIEQIADQLKWSVRQIAEIEAGHYAVLPDLSSLRGFIRTYAKILKLDTTPLLEKLSVEVAQLPIKVLDRPVLDTPFPSERVSWFGRQNSRLQRFAGGLFLICLSLIAIFVYREEILYLWRNVMPVIAPDATSASTPITAGRPNSDRTVIKSESASESPLGALSTSSSPDQSTAPSFVTEMIKFSPARLLVDSPELFIAADSNLNGLGSFVDNELRMGQQIKSEHESRPMNMALNNNLVLNFKQDSWIQIKQLNGTVGTAGTVILSRLYEAGTKEVINVTEPLSMIVGNAPGVEVQWRGQSLALRPQNGSNVANLTIEGS